jgi:hypothetical protein
LDASLLLIWYVVCIQICLIQDHRRNRTLLLYDYSSGRQLIHSGAIVQCAWSNEIPFPDRANHDSSYFRFEFSVLHINDESAFSQQGHDTVARQ